MRYIKQVESTSEAEQKEYNMLYYANVEHKVILKNKVKLPNIVLYYNDGTKQEYLDATEMTWNLISGKTKSYDTNTTLLKAELNNGVTSIDSCTFYNCTSLTSVTIPDSVTIINDRAFSGCSSLTSVTIPDSVTIINGDTFASCSSLTSVTIPDSVTSIGGYAFAGCSGLTSVTIGNGVTSIDGRAFGYCSSLNSVTYKGTAYTSTSSLITALKNGGITVSSLAFENSGLENIVLYYNRSTKQVYEDATEMTWNLIEGKTTSSTTNTTLTNVHLNNGVTSIGDAAFAMCSSLISITICNSVTSIGRGAFYGCSSLTSITIPNSVTSIIEGTFYGCKGLTSFTILDSVTSIGSGAFYYCSKLASVTYKGTEYTSKSELTTALTNGGVTVGSNVFDNTALTA